MSEYKNNSDGVPIPHRVGDDGDIDDDEKEQAKILASGLEFGDGFNYVFSGLGFFLREKLWADVIPVSAFLFFSVLVVVIIILIVSIVSYFRGGAGIAVSFLVPTLTMAFLSIFVSIWNIPLQRLLSRKTEIIIRGDLPDFVCCQEINGGLFHMIRVVCFIVGAFPIYIFGVVLIKLLYVVPIINVFVVIFEVFVFYPFVVGNYLVNMMYLSRESSFGCSEILRGLKFCRKFKKVTIGIGYAYIILSVVPVLNLLTPLVSIVGVTRLIIHYHHISDKKLVESKNKNKGKKKKRRNNRIVPVNVSGYDHKQNNQVNVNTQRQANANANFNGYVFNNGNNNIGRQPLIPQVNTHQRVMSVPNYNIQHHNQNQNRVIPQINPMNQVPNFKQQIRTGRLSNNQNHQHAQHVRTASQPVNVQYQRNVYGHQNQPIMDPMNNIARPIVPQNVSGYVPYTQQASFNPEVNY